MALRSRPGRYQRRAATAILAASTLSGAGGTIARMNRPQPIRSLIPIVTTTSLAETRAFWVDLLGFQVSYDSPFYLGVRTGAPGTPELGFMTQDAETPQAFAGRGLGIVCNVDDADREHARIVAAGVRVADPLADKPWGARSFGLVDPNGIGVWLSHAIPAAVEYQGHAR
jgi:catechol 2,3-dioxygenase-like lactoylglutathione lyase family enzyme